MIDIRSLKTNCCQIHDFLTLQTYNWRDRGHSNHWHCFNPRSTIWFCIKLYMLVLRPLPIYSNFVYFRMSSMEAHSSIDDANIGMKSFEFVFMFNKSTGSPKVFYLMVDPIGKCRLFPKTNTVLFPKLKNLVNFRAVVLDDCLYIIGGKDWETGEHIDKTWRYDPANSRWSQRASLINARCRHTATVLNGCIYITGLCVNLYTCNLLSFCFIW